MDRSFYLEPLAVAILVFCFVMLYLVFAGVFTSSRALPI